MICPAKWPWQAGSDGSLALRRGVCSGCLDPRLIGHGREVEDFRHVAGELVEPGVRTQVEYAVDGVRLRVFERIAQFIRGQKERRVDAAACRFHLDVVRRPVQQEGADVVPGAVAQRAWNVDYQLGEVRAAICGEPRTFMLDNQEFTFEADVSVACLALEVVDAYGCPAAAAGALAEP